MFAEGGCLSPMDLVELAVESALRTGGATCSALEELCGRAASNRPGREMIDAVLARRGVPRPGLTLDHVERRSDHVVRTIAQALNRRSRAAG